MCTFSAVHYQPCSSLAIWFKAGKTRVTVWRLHTVDESNMQLKLFRVLPCVVFECFSSLVPFFGFCQSQFLTTHKPPDQKSVVSSLYPRARTCSRTHEPNLHENTQAFFPRLTTPDSFLFSESVVVEFLLFVCFSLCLFFFYCSETSSELQWENRR